jgi:hypothetical protein
MMTARRDDHGMMGSKKYILNVAHVRVLYKKINLYKLLIIFEIHLHRNFL